MKHTLKEVNLKMNAFRPGRLALIIGGLMGLIWLCRPAAADEARRADQPNISFYHWRTVYDPGPTALERLEQLQVGRLYLRFFEVTVNDDGRPIPQATAVFRQKPHLPIVPVIFLENTVFNGQIKAEELAGKLWQRVMDMAEINGLELIPELHLDCDWTRSTKTAFFEFSAALQNRLPQGWELAVTLRLDQYKNHHLTGIPPAGRGVLMAYNMGQIKRPGPGNSIIDPLVAGNYLAAGGRPYPLPLDLALPIFSWAVVFDEYDRYRGLLSPVPEELDSLDHCLPLGGGMYTVIKPFFSSGGRPLPQGWRLRREESSQEDLLTVAQILRSVPIKSRQLIFYHLDDGLIKDRSREDLEAIAERLK